MFILVEHDSIFELQSFLEKNDLVNKFIKSKQMLEFLFI
jgi:hypothetical protein